MADPICSSTKLNNDMTDGALFTQNFLITILLEAGIQYNFYREAQFDNIF